ncbi:hypothetical protein HMPREF1979_01409 [Actinomyces johnsonii F0542]|uniref:Uncharacterized protein n=1 Tax=Actinomyces johnsonii F0542 TaxID=1321818 RepID=U1RWW5_9ACTO|nr:hypothetical protein HMPREF1979_01409 [Actinomyces johnsonii F0542]
MVVVTPTRTFTGPARAALGSPSLSTSAPYLLTDFSAARRDMTFWAL